MWLLIYGILVSQGLISGSVTIFNGALSYRVEGSIGLKLKPCTVVVSLRV